MERSPAPAARVMLLACLLLALMGTAPRIPAPAHAQEEKCKPWKWFVYHTCASPGGWCHLAIGYDYVENMNKEGMTVLASYRTEKQALTATCNAMSEPRMTGEGAVYPGVKATIGTDVYDVGAFVTYGDGSWPCRDPEPDEDSDGVPDGVPNVYRRDRCPGTPAGTTVDMSGCPCKEGGDCAEQCKVFGSHALGEVKDGTCFCSCEFGYEGDKTGTCVISEAACTKACREYHGTDKSHGPDAYGTVDDDVCNCHCAEGYAPDETLTCVKQESCEEVCQKARGEGATGAGTPPNCRCDCKPAYVPTINYDEQDRKVVCVKKVCPNNSDLNEETGECICREGFHPEPVAGVCVKRTAATRCGNNVCNTEYVDDLYKENCQNCPPDCKCPAGTSCTPTHPGATVENWGCVKVAAKIINMGCSNIRDIPDVSVQRAGTGPDDFFHLGTELPLELNKGDGVRLTTTGLVTRKPCEGAYLTMQWGDTVGTVYLDDALYHDMTIGETAVDSGWPDEWAEWTDPAVGVGKFGLKWGIKWVIKTLVGWKAKVAAGPVISVLMGPGKTAGGAVKVYAKSHLVIWQTPAEVVVHTLEGEAQVDDGKRVVIVGEGMKATVREGATGDPVAFDPAEIPEQYRIDPLALQEELEGSAPEAVVGGPATRTGITGWAAPAACVGLLTALLAGGALVVWQRSRRGRQPRRAPAERGAAAPGLPTRAPHGQATPQRQGPPASPRPTGWGTLSVREGAAPARTLTLGGPALTIGRSTHNDLALRDGLISRQHAQIRRQAGGAVLTDLGSTNGTFLNGQRVSGPQPLQPGDVIHVGHTELVFEPGAPHHPQPAQASRVSLVLDRPVLTIGRSSSCDLVLVDRGISRRHAELRRQAGGAVLTDLGSANGTYVNGRRLLGSCAVQPGDIIHLGNTDLVFKAGGVERR